MHEMAIAQSVLDIAFGEMDRRAATTLRKVKISIGEFSGVVREALEFAFEVLKPDTRAAKAEFEIEVVPLEAACVSCGPGTCHVHDLHLSCPICGQTMQIVSGREMKVDYVDLE